MAKTTAYSIAKTIDHVYDAHGPCRVYIDGADERDKQGRSLWRCYFAIDGGRERQYIKSDPMRWRQAATLAWRLNLAAGLVADPSVVEPEAVSA